VDGGKTRIHVGGKLEEVPAEESMRTGGNWVGKNCQRTGESATGKEKRGLRWHTNKGSHGGNFETTLGNPNLGEGVKGGGAYEQKK